MMENLLPYLMKSGLCLAVFWLVYRLLLQGETFFRANRWYLLGSMMLAPLLPLLAPQLESGLLATELSAWLEPVEVWMTAASPSGGTGIAWGPLLFLSISAGFLLFSLLSIGNILRLRHRGRLVARNPIQVVIAPAQQPFTFLRTIYLDEATYSGPERAQILAHEAVHARQWHSLDVLISECLKVAFWWNPFYWLLLTSLKEVHEFLADEGVLQQGHGKRSYQQLLVNTAAGFPLLSPVNALGYSSIKKRVQMMNKTKSNPLARLKYMIFVPLLLGLSLAMAPLPSGAPLPGGTEQAPQFKGGFEAMVKYIQKELHYPEAAKKAGVEGKVFIEITISKTGKVSKAEVLKGMGYGCDEEALRVVKGMPDWEPGMQDGNPVNAKVTLPLMFAL